MCSWEFLSVSEVHDLLSRNRLFVMVDGSAKLGRKQVTNVNNISDQNRYSVMITESAASNIEDLAIHSSKNEKSSLANLW